ncbi:MAG: LacI family transcriptional regulator, partial [Odoribacter sp.]|nr:LacI family transcriptional regulator [Odoribacter sp.]
MRKNISIYDIAKSLNVSASTVSRALQDHPRISAEVRKMVQEKAREMNYRPNRMAVNLKLGKSRTIGVVVPNINRNFFSSAIDGIEEEAYQEGYDVLIC